MNYREARFVYNSLVNDFIKLCSSNQIEQYPSNNSTPDENQYCIRMTNVLNSYTTDDIRNVTESLDDLIQRIDSTIRCVRYGQSEEKEKESLLFLLDKDRKEWLSLRNSLLFFHAKKSLYGDQKVTDKFF